MKLKTLSKIRNRILLFKVTSKIKDLIKKKTVKIEIKVVTAPNPNLSKTQDVILLKLITLSIQKNLTLKLKLITKTINLFQKKKKTLKN